MQNQENRRHIDNLYGRNPQSLGGELKKTVRRIRKQAKRSSKDAERRIRAARDFIYESSDKDQEGSQKNEQKNIAGKVEKEIRRVGKRTERNVRAERDRFYGRIRKKIGDPIGEYMDNLGKDIKIPDELEKSSKLSDGAKSKAYAKASELQKKRGHGGKWTDDEVESIYKSMKGELDPTQRGVLEAMGKEGRGRLFRERKNDIMKAGYINDDGTINRNPKKKKPEAPDHNPRPTMQEYKEKMEKKKRDEYKRKGYDKTGISFKEWNNRELEKTAARQESYNREMELYEEERRKASKRPAPAK